MWKSGSFRSEKNQQLALANFISIWRWGCSCSSSAVEDSFADFLSWNLVLLILLLSTWKYGFILGAIHPRHFETVLYFTFAFDVPCWSCVDVSSSGWWSVCAWCCLRIALVVPGAKKTACDWKSPLAMLNSLAIFFFSSMSRLATCNSHMIGYLIQTRSGH